MSDSVSSQLDEIQRDLVDLTKRLSAADKLTYNIDEQSAHIGKQLSDLTVEIAAIEKIKEKDPVARKALQQVPALTKSLGGVAGGLKRIADLRSRGASDQDVAAESLRITGSLLEIAATAAALAPPPYGKIAAEVIAAIGSLVTFVAAIIDLCHPAKKEPSVAEVVDKAIRSVQGYAHRDLLHGVLKQLNAMRAGLAELHRQKNDVVIARRFAEWDKVWNLVEPPAGEGVDVRVDAMPSWLMDRPNLDLSPDPWGEVFYLYLLAKGEYLRNWLSAMLLLDQPDPAVEGGETRINPDYLLAAAQLAAVVKDEQDTLRDLTPFAVRKSLSLATIDGGALHNSTRGFAPEGEPWTFTWQHHSQITQIAVGPERRAWFLAEGTIWTGVMHADGNMSAYDNYPTHEMVARFGVDGDFPGKSRRLYRDLCVVPRGQRTSDVFALAAEYFPLLAFAKQLTFCLPTRYSWDEAAFTARTSWDAAFFEQVNAPAQADGMPMAGFDFDRIAASPSGRLYLLWANSGKHHVSYYEAGAVRTSTSQPVPVVPPAGLEAAGELQLHGGATRVWLIGRQHIWGMRHADISRGANIGWTQIDNPATAPGKTPMPNDWRYLSVTESEGGALLACLEIPGVDLRRTYLWHDGEWTVGPAGVALTMLTTVPAASRETFNALKGKIDELVEMHPAT